MSTIKQAILVMSGKGGVGKSTISSQLAMSLATKGYRIGLLDVDICGPSLAHMVGTDNGEIIQTDKGWKPIRVEGQFEFYLMSMAFLTSNKNSAVIWRGPKKHSMIERFITGVDWGSLDYLIVDTPPGTSDEHISLVEVLRGNGVPMKAILVTTPQIVACNDVRREISFCKASKLEIGGLIENMSGFKCPNCSECTKIFSSEGGEALCRLADLNFLGSIPLDPNISSCSEAGKCYIDNFKDSEAAKIMENISVKVAVR